MVGLVAGGLIGYAVTYTDFNNKLTDLQSQLGVYQGSGGSTFLLNENVSLAALYANVKSSVVVIQDLAPGFTMFGQRVYTLQQGSGFVAEVNNRLFVVTNDHVVTGTINVTVTFPDGNSYPATVVGQDPKADIAVLSVSSMPSGVKALPLVSSSTLNVGDPVVAVGTPYGLSGTLTTGIISAIGRTITVGSDNQVIPDTIQTTTPINSGNSGGPLINYAGQVVGITTAGISNSEGLGFAIPSSTLMRVLPSLVSSGSYDQHPSINVVGTDMNYPIAQAMGATVTYGVLVESVSVPNGLQGGSTIKAVLNRNVVVGGDIIIGIGNVRIANTDDLFSYLEQHTLPGQVVTFSVVRNGQTQNVQVTIGNA
ncbi:MAG: trypsin-like peptidase domain-containing protein [Candidatus Bathyarchaeota archaeon]|nr:trypsin-like peptidase domain-containing protein [Candidatus Bathyarchaeota archaeon]